MEMVMKIANPCDTVDESGKWFGIVRWCDDDIIDALEDHNIEATPENISSVRAHLENEHWFTDCMIAAGWDYIDSLITSEFN